MVRYIFISEEQNGKTKNHSTAAFEKAAAGKNNVLFSKTRGCNGFLCFVFIYVYEDKHTCTSVYHAGMQNLVTSWFGKDIFYVSAEYCRCLTGKPLVGICIQLVTKNKKGH